MEATKTIIVRNFGSFFDMCDNELVNNLNVHCTFFVNEDEKKFMEELFLKKGGRKLSTSSKKNFFQKLNINI
ncbi:hypothetical protein NI392_09630 [Vibrio alginolyticus]|uniref:hypothetical protein n=1 Tax=Vibrio TaxID=662 RepID=UPI000CE99721|nr:MULTISPECIES: hypothetical protein [Vibrio]MDW2258499.1 hypothetical protein [Vibrio sp. 1409]AVF76212.1 hypothetical protein AL539_22035 [Vibrio alginolyticus]EGQ7841430.1 hypothetical protein [Vibrio alginolyticus]EJN3800838.1 hypothetical protein [Vibrio alginolyticus]EJR0949669.1 hypothetical protein [Vibrio alginolyticus]